MVFLQCLQNIWYRSSD